MSYKRLLLLIVIISSAFIAPTVSKAVDKDIVFIYMAEDDEMHDDERIIYEMLQAMTEVDLLSVSDVERGTLQQYERLIIFGDEMTALTNEAKQEINAFKGNAVAVGNIALQLQPFQDWHEGDYVNLFKIGQHVLTQKLRWKEMIPSQNVDIIQTGQSFHREFPLVMKVNTSNWSYASFFYNKKPFIYEYPKLLSELLQLPLPAYNDAFIVLSEIDMNTDVDQLRRLVTKLENYHIPIALQVRDLSLHADGRSFNQLETNEKLIKYLQEKSEEVTIILAKSIHTAEKSVDRLAVKGIYPTLYGGDSHVFTSFVKESDSRLFKSVYGDDEIYPYTVPFMLVDGEYPLYEMERTIKQLLQVRGTTISFQFPTYVDEKYLNQLLKSMQHPQIRWLDFKEMNHSVRTKHMQIEQAADGTFYVRSDFSMIDRLMMYFEYRRFELALWGLVITVTLFVLLFFINTLRLRATLRKRLFEERKTNG